MNVNKCSLGSSFYGRLSFVTLTFFIGFNNLNGEQKHGEASWRVVQWRIPKG